MVWEFRTFSVFFSLVCRVVATGSSGEISPRITVSLRSFLKDYLKPLINNIKNLQLSFRYTYKIARKTPTRADSRHTAKVLYTELVYTDRVTDVYVFDNSRYVVLTGEMPMKYLLSQ